MTRLRPILTAALLIFAANHSGLGAAAHRSSKTSVSPWVATWGAAMVAQDAGRAPDLTGKTVREIVHTSVAGNQVRIWISNRFGTEPLKIGAAHVALTAEPAGGTAIGQSTDFSATQPGSDRAVLFHHAQSVSVPPGAEIVSDPVALALPPFADLSVSLYFPGRTAALTVHDFADQRSYAASGDQTAASTLPSPLNEGSWFFLSGVDVSAPGRSAIVAFGDSITDGAYASFNRNHRWPDYLARRLAEDPGAKQAGVLGVVNAGIGGNRVLLDGFGPNAVSRINPDILARSNARFVIVLESINDIGRFMTDRQPYGDLAERLEFAMAQIAAQSHQHGIRVIGATITPYQGCGYYSAGGEKVRQQVNDWIRTSHTFDGVADFDKATRDPNNPLQFAPQYDSGDHLHPKDAGYKAMADSINLAMFTSGQ